MHVFVSEFYHVPSLHSAVSFPVTPDWALTLTAFDLTRVPRRGPRGPHPARSSHLLLCSLLRPSADRLSLTLYARSQSHHSAPGSCDTVRGWELWVICAVSES